MNNKILLIILLASVAFLTPNAFAEINVEIVLDNLKNPWEIEFAPDGKIFFTERDGRLWVIDNESVSVSYTHLTLPTILLV